MVTRPQFTPGNTSGSWDSIVRVMLRKMEEAGHSDADCNAFLAAAEKASSHTELLRACAVYVEVVGGEY